MDVWGPMRVATVGGKRYFISIIDDKSHKVDLQLMRLKSESYETGKHLVELQNASTWFLGQNQEWLSIEEKR